AAGPRHRRFRHGLWRGAHRQRVLPRARSATGFPVRRRHHGHAALGSPRADRRRAGGARPLARRARYGARQDWGGRMSALEGDIRALIATEGPISFERYMELCLAHPRHGYYMTRDPIGADGDFVTAPEISQMFGELIGLWAAQVWTD